MAHSLQYQVSDSIRGIENEVGRLLDLVPMLKEAGNDELAAKVGQQAHKLLEVAVALRMALAD
ncbi:hypothetical protein [Pseudomonas cichorii]|uniref:hypothetical protein n=1 Tax=Pseudomonas cichorii TaxID=36746 RepID=UPI001C88D78B|nr:hypothetical protein [Pseudomonas cichorii]MBX8484109.1 hypothetical protein [Pseudomonas cichorii]MBX8493805.1 hypothetical protein [Pseudomonas cichorii]MBX8513189.1 hypothetical protein [Pseudomonas cichorii]MBX8528629.1 hypothetical protein [Pseudomonas cichorii]MBX8561599.1 hypothetical protein [Pseudomonas cichorii]